MRMYETCSEMHNEVRRDLHEMGVLVHPQTMQDRDVSKDLDYRTLELSPSMFTIIDPLRSDRDLWMTSIGANLGWARAEVNARWNSRGRKTNDPALNPGDAWELRPEVWREYLHDGKFAYTYAERFAHFSALSRVLTELMLRPDTRQAILEVYQNAFDIGNLGGRARVPCSMHYQFLRRPDGLRCYYNMRSTDFITHFPYDVWMAMELQERIAGYLDLTPGQFVFFTGSLHVYAKDADLDVF